MRDKLQQLLNSLFTQGDSYLGATNEMNKPLHVPNVGNGAGFHGVQYPQLQLTIKRC